MARGLEHRRVLDGADEEGGGRPLGGQGRARAQDRQVVRLRAAAHEPDLRRAGAERVGDDRAGILEGGGGLPAPTVEAGGIAEELVRERLHRGPHLGAHRGRGGVVEIHGVVGRHRVGPLAPGSWGRRGRLPPMSGFRWRP